MLDTRYSPLDTPLVVILGPTASGKSALAMQLAKKFSGEIVAADSRTVYKGLDIGTAKPSLQDQQKIPHHLLDVALPGKTFTVYDFKRLADKAIRDIASRGKLPLLVGGSGLYVDSVIFDYQLGEKANEGERVRLNKLSTAKLGELAKAKGATDLDFNNRRRLIRYIELGEVKSDDKQMRGHTLVLGIKRTKEELEARIAARAELIFSQETIKEAKAAADKYGWQSEAMSGVIYKLIKKYLDGELTIEQAKSQFMVRDRQLAKRQMTWFKRNLHIRWVTSKRSAENEIKEFLRRGNHNSTTVSEVLA